MSHTPPQFSHEMLVANAGSGKTYALTTRIIQLMLAGVPANKIAALTFTRKSAGEFLDELLLRLADAATQPNKLRSLARDVSQPELSVMDCCRLLRHLIDHFGDLGLGTIDSFFARIARQFPLESGLPEDFAIADNASLTNARERALAAGFDRSASGSRGLEAMIEQCRQITRRQGERNVFGTLLQQIDALHQSFLATPPDCTWGDARAIWGEGQAPFPLATDPATAVDQFEQAVTRAKPDLSPEAHDNLQAGLDALRALEPGQAWSDQVQNFIEQKLSSSPKNNHIRFAPKKADGWVELTPDVQSARQILLHSLYAGALRQILERSQGLHNFVREFESVYAELVRSAGLISFADITQLLAERADDADTLDALDWRSQVAYRIDQRFDHWLLDEFQDTSRLQWTILRAFIEEAIMDDAAQRSFFYVGDTKQAIYGWRGGDAELFREIFDYYDSIQAAEPLTRSWRSKQPVIEMVNSVFGNVPAVADELKLPAETVAKWELGWNLHTVAPTVQDGSGYAVWRTIEKDPESDEAPQHREILRILQEVDPLAKDIECAVLLRKNKDVAELAAYLQTHGIAVAVEGKSNPCTDNPLGSAVLAALRTVAHPADTLAAAIARGLPCAQAWGLNNLDTFRENTLQSLAESGYARTIQHWIESALGGTSSVSSAPSALGGTSSVSSAPSALGGTSSVSSAHTSMQTDDPREQGAGGREQGAGGRGQGAGSRGQGAGGWEQGAGGWGLGAGSRGLGAIQQPTSSPPQVSGLIPQPPSPQPSNEPFLQTRGEALLAAAEAFDSKAGSSDGIDAFIASVESLEIQEAEASAAIRIMTVHQAKGLGFDMVIVSGLDQSGPGGSTDELVLGPDKQHPRWGLLMPRKDITEQDPLLRQLNQQLQAEARTNELCSAYVALTRAKRALYVISETLDDKSKATHFGKHLQLTLNEDWSAGRPDWCNFDSG